MLTPFPYQIEDAARMAANKHLLNANPVGYGKTGEAVLACDEASITTGLVLCPASVRENWRREFRKFSKVDRDIAVLMGYEKPRKGAINIVSYDGATGKYNEALMGLSYDALIPDEIHFCKSVKAIRTKKMYGYKKVPGFVHRTHFIWPMSATPAPNNPYELYPLCRSLFSKSFVDKYGKPMDSYGFINKFCTTQDNGFGLKITGGKNLAELKTLLEPHIIRREKISRPPIITTLPLTVETGYLATEEMRLVEDAIEGGMTTLQALAIADPHIAALRRALGVLKVAPLSEWIIDQIEGGLEKLVVFGHHTDVLQGIAKNLSKVSQFAYLDGSTNATERDKQVQKFKNDPKCKVFIGQMQAAGTGVDGLQVAEQLVFAEYSWVPAENDQAIGRIDRTGQKGNPLIRFAVVAGSLDERIAAVAARKASTIKEIFN